MNQLNLDVFFFSASWCFGQALVCGHLGFVVLANMAWLSTVPSILDRCLFLTVEECRLNVWSKCSSRLVIQLTRIGMRQHWVCSEYIMHADHVRYTMSILTGSNRKPRSHSSAFATTCVNVIPYRCLPLKRTVHGDQDQGSAERTCSLSIRDALDAAGLVSSKRIHARRNRAITRALRWHTDDLTFPSVRSLFSRCLSSVLCTRCVFAQSAKLPSCQDPHYAHHQTVSRQCIPYPLTFPCPRNIASGMDGSSGFPGGNANGDMEMR